MAAMASPNTESLRGKNACRSTPDGSREERLRMKVEAYIGGVWIGGKGGIVMLPDTRRVSLR